MRLSADIISKRPEISRDVLIEIKTVFRRRVSAWISKISPEHSYDGRRDGGARG
jgi:hypothetical protein